ncbi:MAG: CPBP family intramembrane glutamic endopeptidase [Thermoanaerobaculia bacterium]
MVVRGERRRFQEKGRIHSRYWGREASTIFAWLRLRSGSVWTAVIFHASHNLFLQEVFDPLIVNRGKTEYWTTEFGLGMTLFYGAVAWWCWQRRGELPGRAAETMAPNAA